MSTPPGAPSATTAEAEASPSVSLCCRDWSLWTTACCHLHRKRKQGRFTAQVSSGLLLWVPAWGFCVIKTPEIVDPNMHTCLQTSWSIWKPCSRRITILILRRGSLLLLQLVSLPRESWWHLCLFTFFFIDALLIYFSFFVFLSLGYRCGFKTAELSGEKCAHLQQKLILHRAELNTALAVLITKSILYWHPAGMAVHTLFCYVIYSWVFFFAFSNFSLQKGGSFIFWALWRNCSPDGARSSFFFHFVESDSSAVRQSAGQPQQSR